MKKTILIAAAILAIAVLVAGVLIRDGNSIHEKNKILEARITSLEAELSDAQLTMTQWETKAAELETQKNAAELTLSDAQAAAAQMEKEPTKPACGQRS